MPTEHKPPVFDNTRRPTKEEVLARGARMHATMETGGQAAKPQTYGAHVSDKAAKTINNLMTKLPPAAVQFFIDHAIQADVIQQIRIITGASDNADLVTWVRGIMGIHEDQGLAWKQGMDRITRGMGPQLTYEGGEIENQRALTSSAKSALDSGEMAGMIDVVVERPKINITSAQMRVFEAVTQWDQGADPDEALSYGQRGILSEKIVAALKSAYPEYFT